MRAFVSYTYHVSGIKLERWKGQLDWSLSDQSKNSKKDFVLRNNTNIAETLRPGDVGIASPNGRNHHFMIISVNGNTLTTVDGNDGFQQTIIKRTYSVGRRTSKFIYQANGGIHGVEDTVFLTPNWSKLIPNA